MDRNGAGRYSVEGRQKSGDTLSPLPKANGDGRRSSFDNQQLGVRDNSLKSAQSSSDDIQVKKQDLVPFTIQLPDGTPYKALVGPKSKKTIADVLKSVSHKFGLTPAEDYDVVEIGDESDSVVPKDDLLIDLALRQAESFGLVSIRKRKAEKTEKTSGFRKLNFLTMTRGNNNNNGGSKLGLNLTTSSTSIREADIQQAASPDADSLMSPDVASNGSASSSSLNNSRRLSISDGLSGLFGGKKSKESSTTVAEDAVGVRSIFEMSGTERRGVNLVLIEHLTKIFSKVEGHGLSLGKLAERPRFLSWSRGGTGSAGKSDGNKVFGQPLTTVLLNEGVGSDGVGTEIPTFLARAFEYLTDSALNIPGIFRISGVKNRVNALKESVDNGEDVSFVGCKPHDVASLVKMFFREMPDPLLTHKHYDYFIAVPKYIQDEEEQRRAIKYLSQLLPVQNLLLVKSLFELMANVAEHSNSHSGSPPTSPISEADDHLGNLTTIKKRERLQSSTSTDFPLEEEDLGIDIEVEVQNGGGNLMTPYNLAVVMAPNILRPKDVKAENLENNDHVMKVFERILEISTDMYQVDEEIIADALKSGYIK